MNNNYILTSDGGFASEDELYHAVRKGEQKKDHKYIRREWKNGRWNYEYYNPRAEKLSQDYQKALVPSFMDAAKVVNAESDMHFLKKKNINPRDSQDLISNTKQRAKVRSQWNQARKAQQAHIEDANKVYKEIEKEEVRDLSAKTIAKGVVALKNFAQDMYNYAEKGSKVRATKR